MRNAFRDPAASMTARMSSARSSMLPNPSERSDRPVPRLSKVSTRATPSSCSSHATWGSSQVSSRCEMNPDANTRSTGPSPTTW